MAHPPNHLLQAAMIPTSIFLTNRAGYPVLSRAHQAFLLQLFEV